MRKYKCLILDHDDTVMDSTRDLHYPAFLDALNELRPGRTVTLREYFLLNFDPGFLAYCTDVLHLSEEELKRETDIWMSWTKRVIPKAYPGMARIIRRHVQEGGRIAVVSHSMAENILRDYRENGLPEPEMVFGWERPAAERKPEAFPVLQILEKMGLAPGEAVMIDDLKPGYDMARKCGIDFAACGWAYDVPEIRAFMESQCENYFETPEELEAFLFGE